MTKDSPPHDSDDGRGQPGDPPTNFRFTPNMLERVGAPAPTEWPTINYPLPFGHNRHPFPFSELLGAVMGPSQEDHHAACYDSCYRRYFRNGFLIFCSFDKV